MSKEGNWGYKNRSQKEMDSQDARDNIKHLKDVLERTNFPNQDAAMQDAEAVFNQSCPVCGSPIVITDKGWYCTNNRCENKKR